MLAPATVHPTPRNLPSEDDDRYRAMHEEDAGNRFIDLFALPHEVIGSVEGAPHEAFGSIADLAAGRLGHVFVLDAHLHSGTRAIYQFGAGGAHIATIGSAGNGPGEFRLPEALALGRGGELLLVLDNPSLEVFRRINGAYRYDGTFEALGARDMCATEAHAYVLGNSPDRDGVIHKFSLGGAYEVSFGEPYDDPNAFARSDLSVEALLACSSRHGVVGFVRKRVPAMMAYSEDGNELWRARFADFDPATFTLESSVTDGVYLTMNSIYHNRPGTSIFSSLFEDGPDHFIVQYTTEMDHSDDVPSRHHLYRLHARTGEGTYLGWTAESVLASAPGLVVARSNTRHPQFAVYERMGPLGWVATRSTERGGPPSQSSGNSGQ